MTTNRSTRAARRTSRRTSRPSRTGRRSRVLLMGTASVAGAAALVAGGYAQAAEPARTSSPAAVVSSVSAPAPDRPVSVEHQVGTVLEGTAEAGVPVMVTVYENSLHGSSVQVVLGDPEEDNVGYVEQEGAFIHDGVLDVTVDVQGTPVRFHGTVTPSGKPTKLVEPIQDNGEQIVTKGTNTQLATDVTVTVRGVSAPVAFAPAFAFDLESRKVTLYGR